MCFAAQHTTLTRRRVCPVAAIGAGQEVFALIDREPLSRTTGGVVPEGGAAGARGALAFESVTFGYPSRPEPVVTNISLAVPPGGRVALVGPSGAGCVPSLRVFPRRSATLSHHFYRNLTLFYVSSQQEHAAQPGAAAVRPPGRAHHPGRRRHRRSRPHLPPHRGGHRHPGAPPAGGHAAGQHPVCVAPRV